MQLREHLQISPARPILDFDLQKCHTVYQCCFKPQDLWQLVIAAVGDSQGLNPDCLHLDHFSLWCRLHGGGDMRLGRLPKRDYITRDVIQRLGRKRENVIVPSGHFAWLSVRTQPASPLQDDKVELNYSGRKKTHTQYPTRSRRRKGDICKTPWGCKAQAKSCALHSAHNSPLIHSLSRQGHRGRWVPASPVRHLEQAPWRLIFLHFNPEQHNHSLTTGRPHLILPLLPPCTPRQFGPWATCSVAITALMKIKHVWIFAIEQDIIIQPRRDRSPGSQRSVWVVSDGSLFHWLQALCKY